MKRIPDGRGRVHDNLAPTTQMLMAETNRPKVFPIETPETVNGWWRMLSNLFARDAITERAFFASRLLQFATSGERRRREEYERISWWEFIDAANMSEAYGKFLGYGITQSLVAMRPEMSSTRTIGRIYLQLIRDLMNPEVDADSLLVGPTNETWIGPWTAYLRSLGVTFRPETPVREIHADGGRVTSVTVGTEETERIEADYYVGAVPVEAMIDLRTDDLVAAAPSLSRLDGLDTAWMNGIQFYLREDMETSGATAFTSTRRGRLPPSPSVNSGPISTLQSTAMARLENPLDMHLRLGDAGHILHDRPARECTAEEIKDEVLAQLDAHFDDGRLTEENVIEWFLDPAIEFSNDGRWPETASRSFSTPAGRSAIAPRRRPPHRISSRGRLRAHDDRPRQHGGCERGCPARDERHPRSVCRRRRVVCAL